MTNIENNINGSFDYSLHEALLSEFDPIQSLLMIPPDSYAISRKWFVYDDDENEERYNEDW
mgnify:CR=1 FL=1